MGGKAGSILVVTLILMISHTCPEGSALVRTARRLIASAVLLGLALFIGAAPASADSGWQGQKSVVPVKATTDSGWQ